MKLHRYLDQAHKSLDGWLYLMNVVASPCLCLSQTPTPIANLSNTHACVIVFLPFCIPEYLQTSQKQRKWQRLVFSPEKLAEKYKNLDNRSLRQKCVIQENVMSFVKK